MRLSVSASSAVLSATLLAVSFPITAFAADRAHFEIERVKLGMTIPQLMEIAKANGKPTVSKEADGDKVEFKTHDLLVCCHVFKVRHHQPHGHLFDPKG